MADPYLPALEDFQFSDEELAAINSALQTARPWDWKPGGKQEELIDTAKAKIRTYHMERHGSTCCYCRTNLAGAGHFMTDREHILPKGTPAYKAYAFTMWNLAIACKRCNMQFKGDDDDFVVEKTNSAAYLISTNYRLIHPNFDRWEDHLERTSVQVNNSTMVKISAMSTEKAAYTHAYFDLHGLEVDTFDKAQAGAPPANESELALEIRKLARSFGQ